jgi:hypothetical protein
MSEPGFVGLYDYHDSPNERHKGILFFLNLVSWCLGGYFLGSFSKLFTNDK